jgi:hypothetical protein
MGEWRNACRGLTENAKERDNVETLDVDGRTLFKGIVIK